MKIKKSLIQEEVELVRSIILERNMSYCRFENTAIALQDCVENWGEQGLSETEKRGRERILEMAQNIVEMGLDYQDEQLSDDEDENEYLRDKRRKDWEILHNG